MAVSRAEKRLGRRLALPDEFQAVSSGSDIKTA
jgi:hypothetical protein